MDAKIIEKETKIIYNLSTVIKLSFRGNIMLKAILFDLDHTLYDREASLQRMMPDFCDKVREYINDGVSFERFKELMIEAEHLHNYHTWKDRLEYMDSHGALKKYPDQEEYRYIFNSTMGPFCVNYDFTFKLLADIKDMGYKIANRHFAKATEDGSDPSYSDIKKLQNDIKHKKIAFFVENTQSDSKVISSIVSLCRKYDVQVIKVTETTPKGKDYLQWMSSEYEQVLKIQEDGK